MDSRVDVLLVDDSVDKTRKIREVVGEIIGDAHVAVAVTVADAYEILRKQKFDLLVLDLKVPPREGEEAIPDGGMRILRTLKRKATQCQTPEHILGLSEFEELVAANAAEFDQQLWHLIRYDPGSDSWALRLAEKLVHIVDTKSGREDGARYRTDLAIVTALQPVELEAVLALDGNWKEEVKDGIPFQKGRFKRGTRHLRVVATAAGEMGMPAATAVAMNAVATYRPRYLAMVGIAAGCTGNFGDILVATHAWDYGAGKSRHREGRSAFLPAPSEIPIEPAIKAHLGLFVMDESVVRKIQDGWTGTQPKTDLRALMGPIASGSAVLENRPFMDELRARDRKLIGVEMEAYGILMAARYSKAPRPVAFVVKSVCDFGTEEKDDTYQSYAAYTSARFVYEFALQRLCSG